MTESPHARSGSGPLLVGRGAEVKAVDGVLDRLLAGGGGVLWIEGEAGIGKSALVGTLAERAASRGVGVLQAAADELAPGWPLRLLSTCVGARTAATSPSPEISALRAGIAGLLRGDAAGRRVADPVSAAGELILDLVDRLCALGPQVLIADDLHWADEPSLRLWGQLADSVGQIPLLLVGASRSAGESAALDRIRARAGRLGTVLRPGPLGAADVEELAGRLVAGVPGPRLLAELDRARGNPLYVVELLAALCDEGMVEPAAAAPGDAADPVVMEFTGSAGAIPDSLATAIGARLGHLDPRLRSTLRMAALLGIEFGFGPLSALAGLPLADLVADLTVAQEAGLIEAGASGMVFRHALIHQVLTSQTPEPVARALHQEIAQILVGSGARLDAVARHLLAVSGDLEPWAVHWLAEVPVSALYTAPRVAEDLLTRALGSVDESAALWRTLAAHLAQVQFWTGRDAQAIGFARRAAAHEPEPEARGAMWTLAVRAAGRAGLFRDAAAFAEEGLATPGLGALWRSRIESWHAIVLKYLDDGPGAARAAESAVRHAMLSGDPLSIAYTRHMEFGASPSAATLGRFEAAAARLGGDAESADLRVLSEIAAAMWRHREEADPAVRDRIVADLQLRTERLGTVRGSTILQIAVVHCFERGRWDEALAYADRVDPEHRVIPNEADTCLGLPALIHLVRGRRQLADAALAELDAVFADPALAPSADKLLSAAVQARALRAEADGDLAGALAAAAGILRGAAGIRRAESFSDIPVLVRAALAAGDRAAAVAAHEALTAVLADTPRPGLAAAAAFSRAMLDADPDAMLAVAATMGTLGWALRRGNALEEAAELLARSGRAVEARAALAEALECYGELDAQLLARRAGARLRALGVRLGPRSRHRRARTGWEALTPTERRVAALVGTGLSNPEIAARLFLSRYTVQTHVSNILGKLGFGSRVELVRAHAERRSDVGDGQDDGA